MKKTNKSWFKSILSCESSEGRRILVVKFFNSLSDQSPSGLTKLFMEFFEFVQEKDPQLYEQLLEHLEKHLESDTGEYGFGGDWWKAARENDDN